MTTAHIPASLCSLHSTVHQLTLLKSCTMLAGSLSANSGTGTLMNSTSSSSKILIFSSTVWQRAAGASAEGSFKMTSSLMYLSPQQYTSSGYRVENTAFEQFRRRQVFKCEPHLSWRLDLNNILLTNSYFSDDKSDSLITELTHSLSDSEIVFFFFFKAFQREKGS